MSRPRTACPDCALPFYSDTNDSCPYCEAAGPTDARAAPGRERVTCSDCGLPHYADVGECPYCATAEAAGGAETDTGEAETDTDESTTADPARERVTCSDCGLAHYADAEECPYCATAAANTAAAPAEPEPESEPAAETEPESDPAAAESASASDEDAVPPTVERQRERKPSGRGNPTLVGRVLGAVRSLFGR